MIASPPAFVNAAVCLALATERRNLHTGDWWLYFRLSMYVEGSGSPALTTESGQR